MDSRFSPNGGAVRALVIILGLFALGIIATELFFSAGYRSKDLAAAGMNLGMLWIFLGVLVLAVLALFMPWFAYVAARESTKAAAAAERIEELLRAQQEQQPWQAPSAESEDPTIYPVKSPPKISRLR